MFCSLHSRCFGICLTRWMDFFHLQRIDRLLGRRSFDYPNSSANIILSQFYISFLNLNLIFSLIFYYDFCVILRQKSSLENLMIGDLSSCCFDMNFQQICQLVNLVFSSLKHHFEVVSYPTSYHNLFFLNFTFEMWFFCFHF